MSDAFGIVLTAIGLLLVGTGVGTIFGRRRIARNIRASRAWTTSEGKIWMLGIFQIGLGVASLIGPWTLIGSQAAGYHSRSIERLFEGLAPASGIVLVVLLIGGVVGIGSGVWMLAAFMRSARSHDAADFRLSPADLRRVYFATGCFAFGVLSLFSSVFFLSG